MSHDEEWSCPPFQAKGQWHICPPGETFWLWLHLYILLLQPPRLERPLCAVARCHQLPHPFPAPPPHQWPGGTASFCPHITASYGLYGTLQSADDLSGSLSPVPVDKLTGFNGDIASSCFCHFKYLALHLQCLLHLFGDRMNLTTLLAGTSDASSCDMMKS